MIKRKLIWVLETDKEHIKRKKRAIDLSIPLEQHYRDLINKGERK